MDNYFHIPNMFRDIVIRHTENFVFRILQIHLLIPMANEIFAKSTGTTCEYKVTLKPLNVRVTNVQNLLGKSNFLSPQAFCCFPKLSVFAPSIEYYFCYSLVLHSSFTCRDTLLSKPE